MNKIPNRQAICEVLMKHAETDKDIVVLCSDSRGSASLTPFANAYPEQFVEMGIAEQDLVSVSAGLAKCGKKAFAASPACFLSTRSYEQAKIDCAYSNTNVKLIGISGGVSYGALGMSHHSAQDIAAMAAIPNMRVYLPSDRFQTAKLVEALLTDEKPAYIRVGRNAVADIYSEENTPFEMDKATALSEGTDVLLVACGEMVRPALDAAAMLKEEGISVGLLDMYCVKPLDKEGLVEAAKLLFSNKYYLMICATYICQQIYSAMLNMGIYYMIYILKNEDLYSVFSWAINIPVIIAMCITPMLVEKMKGLYRMNLAGYILGTAGRVGVIFAGYMGSVPLMLAFTAVAALGMAPWQGDMGAVIASCSEYTYLTKHKHIDGTMYSCTSFGTKIGGGIGVALCGWLLDASGFVKEATIQPESCLNMLHVMYLWIPMVLSLVITFIMSRMNVEDANKKLRKQLERKEKYEC